MKKLIQTAAPLTALVITFVSLTIFANEGIHTRIHHHYQSPRALGMGDAFVAIANDYSGIMYNPAALARREDGQMNFSMDFAFAPTFFEFISDAAKAGEDADAAATDADRFDVYNEFLSKYYGKNFQFRMGLFEAFWARKNWGVAFIPMDLTLEYKIHNQAAPSLNLRAYADTSVVYAHAKTFENILPGSLQGGASVKFVNRGYINKQVNAFDMVSGAEVFSSTDFREGYTIDFDLGALYTPEISEDSFFKMLIPLKPTLGLVLRNLIETGFGQSLGFFGNEGGTKPEKLYRVLDVGAKLDFPELWVFGGRMALDIRDIGHPAFNLRKGLHLGAEFDWTMQSWWKGSYRLGLNQGYLTAGISALFAVFNLDLLTYGEDVGTLKSPKENRVWMAKFNLDF